MGFEYVSKLPTPDEIRAQFPLAPALAAEKAKKDESIKDVFTGKSDKFLVIIGPCSADREDSVCEYVSRLAKVQEKVKDRLILIPRIYTNKPRTTGDGYKGLLHQPNPEQKPNLYEGLIAIRKLHMRVIEETGFSTADEMLYPENLTYLSDVMSYIAVGARSVENQQHRLVSSGIDVPVGMKNPTSGALSVMLNAVHAAQHGHEFIYRSWEVKTEGNPLTHCILRGAVNKLSLIHIFVDPSHATGVRAYVEPMAKAAVSAGADGLMIEVHPCPEKALSDGPQSLTFQEFDSLMNRLRPYASLEERTL